MVCSPGYFFFGRRAQMDNNTVNRNHDETLYSVGETCRITGITRKTLFYYDRIGLLVPYERTEPQQFKLYDRERLERLNGIIEYRRAGLRIAEIRALLDDCYVNRLEVMNGALERLLQEKNGVDRQIRNLKELIDTEENLARRNLEK